MNYQEKSDHALLELALHGDDKAFSAIFDRHWNRLYKTALALVDNGDIAEDIVQDCFVSLWEKGIHAQIENLQAYLLQSIKYRSFMHLRSGAISQKHLSRMNAILITNSIEEAMNASELERTVENTLHALPEKCREVFYMSRVEQLSHKKIAEKLNISTKTVENHITKALRTLRLSVNKIASFTLAFLVIS